MNRPGHYWLEGRSNNTSDPVLIIDPWTHEFEVKDPGYKSKGEPVAGSPGLYCKCE